VGVLFEGLTKTLVEDYFTKLQSRGLCKWNSTEQHQYSRLSRSHPVYDQACGAAISNDVLANSHYGVNVYGSTGWTPGAEHDQ